MPPFLGCIADDYTGASDIASQLAESGVRTVQLFGVPQSDISIDPCAEAVVIGLKTRTDSVVKAVSNSQKALNVLKQLGCQRFYFKYCSTFDSTAQGNIGPVADVLADTLEADPVVFCPAFPANGRTVYHGHLFVHGKPLDESSLANHPLTPMTDANLVRWLAPQTKRSVGLLSIDALEEGQEAAVRMLEALQLEGNNAIVVDTLNSHHLQLLGEICSGHRLVTGGSALASELVRAWRRQGVLGYAAEAGTQWPKVSGRAVILSGSCSQQSNRQVAYWRTHGGAAYQLNPADLVDLDKAVDDALAWIGRQNPASAVMVYATAEPDSVAAAQKKYGRGELGRIIEQAFVAIAKSVVRDGTQTLIVAGGETSGAVVQGLELSALQVGPSIAAGVPWMFRDGNETLAIALKSGNFGSDAFYQEALDSLAMMQKGGEGA